MRNSGYPLIVLWYGAGLMLNHIGVSFLWPLHTVYMSEVFGQSVDVAGFVLLVHFSVQFVGNILGGVLFDTCDGKWMIVGTSSLLFTNVVAMAFEPSFTTYFLCMLPLGFLYGVFQSASASYLHTIWPHCGRKGTSILYVSLNIGGAIGTALGSILASYSYQFNFIGSSLATLLFLCLFLLLPSKVPTNTVETSPEETRFSGNARMNVRRMKEHGPILLLSIGLGLSWIMYMQWQTTFPLHLSKSGIPIHTFNLLWTINAVIVIVLQPLVARWVNSSRLSLKQQIVIGGFLFLLAACSVVHADSFTPFIIAMVVMSLGEMLVWPGVPAIAMAAAPADQKGLYQGVVAAGPTLGRMVGPLAGGVVYETYSPFVLTLFICFLCILSLLSFLLYDKMIVPKVSAEIDSQK